MKIHPLADIFPAMPASEFDALKADIATHGQREPVWTKAGSIIDGRHRWRACEDLGIACNSREYEGEDVAAFVVSLNLRRRHLDESQRAMVAASLANLERGRPLGNPPIGGITSTEAAGLLNVGVRTVERAKQVLQDGAPELVEAVQAGQISVSTAAEASGLDMDTQTALVSQVLVEGRKPAEVLREFKQPHVANNSGNNEWYTPPEFISAARSTMGRIDVDPASSEIANQTVRAQTFYTSADNGLERAWRGAVWMNPPYAQPLIAEFCEAVTSRYASGQIEQACVLVNNGTETGWFHRLLDQASAVCFVKSRIRFLDPSGNPSGAPLQGQVVVYFGKDPRKFAREFKALGVTLFA